MGLQGAGLGVESREGAGGERGCGASQGGAVGLGAVWGGVGLTVVGKESFWSFSCRNTMTSVISSSSTSEGGGAVSTLRPHRAPLSPTEPHRAPYSPTETIEPH